MFRAAPDAEKSHLAHVIQSANPGACCPTLVFLDFLAVESQKLADVSGEAFPPSAWLMPTRLGLPIEPGPADQV